VSRSRKLLTGVVLLALMAAFGAGVNRFLASRDGSAFARPKDPTQVHVAPQFSLPGTIYFADGGGLFSLTGTKVTQLQPEGRGWTEPVVLPDGSGLLAVKVTPGYYSDLYELSLSGTVEQQLSSDSGKVTATSLGADDWIYYPAVGPGNTLYFSYDYPKGNVDDASQCCYQVDFSIWETTLGTEIDRSDVQSKDGVTQESWANYYTGGDVSPVPLDGGGLLYVDYESAYGDTAQLSTPLAGAVPGTEVSQIRMDPKPLYNTEGSDGPALTQPGDDCAQPALNATQTEIAMICTSVVNGAPSSTESDLVVASFDAATGSLGPLDRLVVGTMAAAPAWSPDGTDLVYLAPEAGDGYLQLWYLKGATALTPSPPKQITSDLDLDGSAPVWTS
jgi:hypothetical protein